MVFACGTSEDASNEVVVTDDTVNVVTDTLNGEALRDSTHAIIHGSQDQEKVDSIKKAKQEERKKE